jgi:hypothetical protein
MQTSQTSNVTGYAWPKRTLPGIYQQLPNRNSTVVDAVGDTFMSPEEWTEHQQQNLAMLAQLGQSQSPGKSAMEDSLKKRAALVVRIDTTPRGPRAQRVQTWAQDLPVTPRHQEPPSSEPESQEPPETTPDTTAAPASATYTTTKYRQARAQAPTPPSIKPLVTRMAADPTGGDAAVITLLLKLLDKVDAL